MTQALDLEATNASLADADATAVLRFALDSFGPRTAFASSFGAEDMVLLDLLLQIDPAARVFTLDTGRLPEETYALMAAASTKYQRHFEVYFPDSAAIEQLERGQGFYSFRDSVAARKECCRLRKIEPLRRALIDTPAWITGLRREQAVTRTAVQKVELDAGNGNIYKINPLADWTEQMIWDYIRQHDLPYNKLHDQNYPSIGCAPCTRAVQPGEDVRAGRWWWETPEQKECGLHKAA